MISRRAAKAIVRQVLSHDIFVDEETIRDIERLIDAAEGGHDYQVPMGAEHFPDAGKMVAHDDHVIAGGQS